MTCILALENGAGDDYVMVSDKAAAQPDVQLGMREGEPVSYTHLRPRTDF